MRRALRWVFAVLALGLAGAAVWWIVLEQLIARVPVHTPPVRSIPIEAVFPPRPSVRFTITADWRKVPVRADVERVLSDPALWQRMHFDDWDTLPAEIRDAGLRRMYAAYADRLRSPRRWDQMTPADWDAVPQPMRALAFMQMMRYWSGFYQVGATYDLPRGLVADTLNAILMVESWFEHRAISISRSGNRDLGVGQMSDFARATLLNLHRRRLIDYAPADDDGYFDPWQATRMSALWLDLMLDEQGGDLDAAIRAYHRGTPLAMTPEGETYLVNVRTKRRRFIRNLDGTPAWSLLMRLGASSPPARN